MAEIQIFFLGDCFLLAHPVYDATHKGGVNQCDSQAAFCVIYLESFTQSRNIRPPAFWCVLSWDSGVTRVFWDRGRHRSSTKCSPPPSPKLVQTKTPIAQSFAFVQDGYTANVVYEFIAFYYVLLRFIQFASCTGVLF